MRVRGRWREELLLAVAFGLVYFMLAPEPGPHDLPKVVSAFVVPVAVLIIAGLLLFLLLLLRTPVVDHRKLVSERNNLQRALQESRDAHEHLLRSIHLRARAHDWSLNTGNRIRTLRDVIQKGHSFDSQTEFRQIQDFLRQVRADLQRLGQPALAAQLQVPEDHEAPRDAQGCIDLVLPIDPIFRQWSHGHIDFQPFSAEASDEGLQLPAIYPP